MASKYIQMFPIPEGFPELLNDLAKEVIRNQPEDILEFSSLYFKCMQEGTVLEYHRKGKNIPCDFKTSVPTVKKQTVESEEPKATFEKKEKIKESSEKTDNAKITFNDKAKYTVENPVHSPEKNPTNQSNISNIDEMKDLSKNFVGNVLHSSIEHFKRNSIYYN